ncbi:MAG: cysteine desulfurase family protein [Mycobacteriales bacterium]
MVSLDAASGLPLHPLAREAWLAALEDGWADPARLYGSARRARQLLDGARSSLAAQLGCRVDELRLAPNGTQALYGGVRGVRAARARVGAHVVHSAIEHSATLHACAEGPATSVPVDLHGRISVDEFAAAVQSDTVLACLIAASHEVGTVQPAVTVPVPLLVDACQVIGRAPLPDWDLLAGSSRKWGGPALGVLAVRTGVRWVSPWPEEDGFPGSVDLPAALAAAVALEAVALERVSEDARLRPLVARIRATAAELPDVEVVGDPDGRLPHLVTFSVLYVDGESLVRAFDQEGFEVSSGSSCTSSVLEPSHVLVAMGVSTHGSVRVSLSRSVTEDDVDRFCAALPAVVERLRS